MKIAADTVLQAVHKHEEVLLDHTNMPKFCFQWEVGSCHKQDMKSIPVHWVLLHPTPVIGIHRNTTSECSGFT